MRKAKLDEQKSRVHKLGLYYASSLVESASLYGQPLLEKQVPVMDEIMDRNKQLQALKPYLKAHWSNQKTFLQKQKIDADAWLTACKAVKQ